MSVWRRILTIILAAAMTVGPAVACGDFCPQSGSFVERDDSIGSNSQAAVSGTAMPEGCADAASTPAEPQPQSHNPDCQGCADCPAVASVKSPALAFVGTLSIDAPTVITIDVIVSPVADFFRPARHRLTPPANGPPIAATPVILKDILRL
jgi:hypothetical protein